MEKVEPTKQPMTEEGNLMPINYSHVFIIAEIGEQVATHKDKDLSDTVPTIALISEDDLLSLGDFDNQTPSQDSFQEFLIKEPGNFQNRDLPEVKTTSTR